MEMEHAVPAPRQRRSDARRNMDAILEAAAGLLAKAPTASMQEIAEAAGVHRATVHRHFASKEDLLRAVREQSLDAFIAVLEEHSAREGDAAEILRDATTAALQLGDRYRVWRYTPSFDDLSEARGERFATAGASILAPARAAGAIRDDLPLEHALAAWGGLLLVAQPMIASGTTIEMAADFVLAVLRPPATGA